MRSDSTILLSGWSASRVSRRAKAGTNKNARHSPALTAHPPLRSWTLARAFISPILLPHPSFRIFFPSFPFLTFSFLLHGSSSRATLLVSSLSFLEAHQRLTKYLARSSSTPSQRRRRRRRRRRLLGALNVTVSPHVENEESAEEEPRNSFVSIPNCRNKIELRMDFFLFLSSWQLMFVFFFSQTRNETLRIESIYI